MDQTVSVEEFRNLFSHVKATSIKFNDSHCRFFAENGYNYRIELESFAKLMNAITFSANVRFNGLTRVTSQWFQESAFWRRALKDTSKVYVHGVWDADSLYLLLKFLPKLTKICFTYWRCSNIIPLLQLLKPSACKDIVIDMRGVEHASDDISLGSPERALKVLNYLPDGLSSLFIIFEEYFEVQHFKNVQMIVKSKMAAGGQAVLFFNGELDCMYDALLYGRLCGFGFKPHQPCHIASYAQNLNMYYEQKNMDAFNVYYNVHQDVSYVVGARITVSNGYNKYNVVDNRYPAIRNAGNDIWCTTDFARTQVHHENEQLADDPATGRKYLPKGTLHYDAPATYCCVIRDLAEAYPEKDSKKQSYTYGMPIFRRQIFLYPLREKCSFLVQDEKGLYVVKSESEERVREIVYFPKHVELHLDNGFISRPDINQIEIYRLIRATENLIVHSTSAERTTIDAISFIELLQDVKSIEFRGKWWGRNIYQFVKRRPACLQKFSCFGFSSQRSSLAELWKDHENSKERHITSQLTHLSCDARDIKYDNLYDVLRTILDDRTRDGTPKVAEQKYFEDLLIVVSKFSGGNIINPFRFNFEKAVQDLLKITEPGAHIKLAILNAIGLREAKESFNFVSENDLTAGILKMKRKGETLLPQIYYACGPYNFNSDLVLKLFESNYENRVWHIAIPFDC